jgi:hypothetical protein
MSRWRFGTCGQASTRHVVLIGVRGILQLTFNLFPQALRLDTPDTTSKPHLSSAPDDTFYLLKVVLYRLVTSSSLPTLQRMIALVSEAIETDYLGGIKRKMDGVYTGVRNAGAALATQGGQSKGGEAERMEREMRGSFVVISSLAGRKASPAFLLTSQYRFTRTTWMFQRST